jgi:GMP synthase-like glutamine amidotransferase
MRRSIVIIKHVEQEGAGFMEPFLREEGWGLDIIELALGERLPDAPGEYGAVIVLGGPMNVYQVHEYPFLEEEEHFIRKALAEEVPMLGICLGAQLLAKACGARVKKAAHKEVGWFSVGLTKEGMGDGLFTGFPGHMKVFQWHEDTFEIPAGGVLLARGKTCRNQAFRMGRNAYGLQFHVEATPSMIEEWMKDEGGKIDTAKVFAEGVLLKDAYEEQARRFCLNFKALIEASPR